MSKRNNYEFICDDKPIEMPEQIKNMTDEEIEKEFRERFGEYLNN